MSGSRVAQISVPSDSHSIAIARRFVSQILADLAWVTPAMVDDVRLVASELVTNAVRAQRRVDDSATIAIRAAGFDDRFELTVFRRPAAGPRPAIALTATWEGLTEPVVLAQLTERTD